MPFSAPKYGVEESLRQGRAAFRKLDEELRELGLHQFGVDATR